MTEEPIPNDIRQFIFKCIDSVAQLEALLLLRANPQENWNTASISKRLYITEQEAAPLLANLCDQELVVLNEFTEFVYQPASAELSQMVDSLAAIYARHLVPVTNLIHSKPRSRIREFANAFRLRKDE